MSAAAESPGDYAAKKDYLFKFVPPQLREQLKLDYEASYSLTDMHSADKITRDLARFAPTAGTVLDATACVGGNTYSFSRVFAHVAAMEIHPTRFQYLQHNMAVLGAANVRCLQGDALELVARPPHQRYAAIFIDSPWGGPDYKKADRLQLHLSGLPLAQACRRMAPHTELFCIKTPTNFDADAFLATTQDFLTLVWQNAHLRKIHAYILRVRTK